MTAEERSALLEKYGPYIRSLATNMRKKFGSPVKLERLVACGQTVLLEAADRFDAKTGANFLTLAHYRIKGAIIRGLQAARKAG